MSPDSRSPMVVIYDGRCPFCDRFVAMMALREAVGGVELIDARGDDPRVKEVERAGFDLDGGMVALFGGAAYHGADAVALIAALTNRRGVFGRALGRLLSDPARAKALYPAMRAGRRLALRALGRPLISEKP